MGKYDIEYLPNVKTMKLEKDDIINYAKLLYKQNNPKHLMFQFKEDYAKIYFIQRLFRSYKTSGEISMRLLINYVTVLYNAFGPHFTPFFFIYIDPDTTEWNGMYTILREMNRIPTDQVLNMLGVTIDLTNCITDQKILHLFKEELK